MKILILKNIKLILLVLFFIFGLGGFLTLNIVFAQTSKDVIAIRVIPNLEHYSPMKWYEESGFEGAPQNLLVDGYEAVRDGRTVYVNAANVSGKLYTNIYLISYNQEAESKTIDIFGEILSHWKFNTNIDGQGRCRNNPSLTCSLDSQCSQGDFCIRSGTCASPAGRVCFLDSDCDAGATCTLGSSPIKAEVIRDTKRLSDMAGISLKLTEYFNNRKIYPKLLSGTYLPTKTISTWPSWQDNLGAEIGVSSMLADPINKLGNCGSGYNSITCWNELNKEFAGNTAVDKIDLPHGSYVYLYIGRNDGSMYNLQAVYESGLVDCGAEWSCYSGSFFYP